MRSFLLAACLGIFMSLSAQQKITGHFILKGNVTGQDGNWMDLSYNSEGKAINDSVQIVSGRFRFEGSVKEPTMAYLSGKTKTRSVDDPNFTTVFLEPAMLTASIDDGKFKQAIITGSKTHTEYTLLQSPLNKLRNRWKPVMDTLSAVNKRSNAQYQELKEWVLVPYYAELREIEYAFYDTHRESYVTAYQLRFRARELTTDSLKLFYNRFPDKVKESINGRLLLTEISKRKIGVPGAMAANFNTVDINGNKFSLADYKGKYVLLDFWASWCVPCRKGNPHLKELYAKYNAKGFEVVGVSDDDRDNAAWRKAVAQDGLPWKHVLRGLKSANGVFDRSADINESFNISSLPTQILIDPAGKIIARYGDGGEDHALLDSKLESLIKL
ncbi:MAG: alkyl hydroperoxide reductase/Thiol specific antioxidant/Mal allergen [Sediminibacterium sp.]|nr:alkyl hydroperoxide reductase/Thiol specific antioxidant/Mal allergen [Sediminibacterium sp.]